MAQNTVILIAEDDDGHYVLTRNLLHRSGIENEMIRLVDGQETLEFFRQDNLQARDAQCPYILLLDIRMPKVDGLKVLETVKKKPELKKMPVIMVTTCSDAQQIQHCRELGCDSYIIKPVTNKLVKQIMKYLSQPVF